MDGRTIEVEPAVASILGLSIEDVKRLGVRELCDLAFDRGYVVEVSSRPAASGAGHVTVTTSDAALTPPPSGQEM